MTMPLAEEVLRKVRTLRRSSTRDLLYRLSQVGARNKRREQDWHQSTFVKGAGIRPSHRWVLPPRLGCSFLELADAAASGVFDPLGSGATVAHGPSGAKVPPGAQRDTDRLREMVEGPYEPIAWQRDLRSGYEWNPLAHCREIVYHPRPGVDVKSPWELGRLQHLPWFALAFGATSNQRYRIAFRNQALDFLASNPPRWGVQWACPMDVAIRGANLVLASEMFRSTGVEFDEGFTAAVAGSLLAHGRHILTAHLEWHPTRRTNHLLSCLTGLIWIATALESTDETRGWRALAEWQLGQEILHQFHPDGSNFEASTAYHRLSTEMAIWALARLAAFPENDAPPGLRVGRWTLPPAKDRQIPGEALRRVRTAVQFLEDVSAPDGLGLQIGDNDSGRLFKLDGEDRIELSLDFSGTIAAGKALFGESADGPNAFILNALVRDRTYSVPSPTPPIRVSEDPSPLLEKGRNSHAYDFQLGEGVWKGLQTVAYPDFGLFIYRSPRALLAIRCGANGQDGYGGHAHNDALSIELWCDGKWLIRDPGSYVYGADPKLRDAYRSVRAHFAPSVAGKEPNPLDGVVFRLPDRAKAKALRFDVSGFSGMHFGYGKPVWRKVELTETGFRIEDRSELPLEDLNQRQPPPISLGFGHREEAECRP